VGISKLSVKKLMAIAVVLQIVWGIVPSTSKIVISEIPVELFIAIRWTISGLVFFAIVFMFSKWPPLFKKETGLAALLGILGYGLGSIGTLYGLKIGGVTNFALMGAVSPIITSIVAIVLLNEKPIRMFYIALSLCVMGMFFLISGKYQISTWNIALSSSGLILTSAFLEAVVFIYSRKLSTHFSSIQYLAISQLSAAIFIWLAQALWFKQIGEIANLSPKGWAACIFVSVVACVLCYLILYWLLKFMDGHRLALFDGIHTLSASIIGVAVLGETIHFQMLIGGLFIFLGILVGNLKKSPKAT